MSGDSLGLHTAKGQQMKVNTFLFSAEAVRVLATIRDALDLLHVAQYLQIKDGVFRATSGACSVTCNPKIAGLSPAKEASNSVARMTCLHTPSPGGTLNTVSHV